MLLLIGFAFLAGIVTVLSPCILPVLPIVLSGSVGGGKARPWGIITGFIVSFTLFTLTLSAIVQALGVDPGIMRWIAASLILIFGIVMVVPVLKDGFMAFATKLTSRSTTVKPGKKAQSGYWSGLVLGLSLGLVWTPCVGPIMASVISLALSQSVDTGSVLITIAYCLGTSIPLFFIMQGGRALLNRFPFFTKHTSGIQKFFGVFMLLTALALFTGVDRMFQTWLLQTFPQYGSGLTAIEDQKGVQNELKKRAEATAAAIPVTDAAMADPLTVSTGTWINSPKLTLGALKGKVVLVDIWTYSCINCIRTLPYLEAWYKKYQPLGLEIVGVHSPEFAFERDLGNVTKAAKDLGVTWPIVQDNDFKVWNAYHNSYWPAHYLYGKDGSLQETHFGEGNYAETEALIQKLLGTSGPLAAQEIMPTKPVGGEDRTPETYLGLARASNFASPEKPNPGVVQTYSVPANLAQDNWGLAGPWLLQNESITNQGPASLVFHFQGKKVYQVLNPVEGGAKEVTVSLDGKPYTGGEVKNGVLKLDSNRLYQLFDSMLSTKGLLKIDYPAPVKAFAFTFG